MVSSYRDDWETPWETFDALNEEFGFTLDPCATAQNAKCQRYFTKEDDGLVQKWGGRVFMNPPYGRKIGKWIEKAYKEAREQGIIVVALIPARTDTSWWHEWVMRADEIRFIRGRLSLGGETNHHAPFPSAVVVFRPGPEMPGHGLRVVSVGRSGVPDRIEGPGI